LNATIQQIVIKEKKHRRTNSSMADEEFFLSGDHCKGDKIFFGCDRALLVFRRQRFIVSGIPVPKLIF